MAEILSGAREASKQQDLSQVLFTQITEQISQLSQNGELTIELLDEYQNIISQIIENISKDGQNTSSNAVFLDMSIRGYRAGLKRKSRNADSQL